jgi:short-subunit dehydrogenase
MLEQKKKVVLITGASSGIGLATAIYLIYRGYIVFGTSRNPNIENFHDILKERYIRDHTKWKFTNKEKTEVKEVGSLICERIEPDLDEIINKIQFYKLDVTDNESVTTCINSAWEDSLNISGGIDVLVNNAGDGYYGSIEEMDLDEQKKQFEVNYWGQIRTIQSILPLMRERRNGLIINCSSLAAYIPIPYSANYSASKAAVMLYTSALRSELKQFNIKVSCVAPGDINSNFDANMVDVENSTDLKSMIEKIPIEKNSVYYNEASLIWKEIIKNLIVSPPPTEISKTIRKIIEAKKPRIIYMSGSFFQRALMVIKRRIISNDLAVKLTEIFYGL